MSIVTWGGFMITEMESDITCPVCRFEFDASDKIEKADLPVFKMKCPACKSWLGISMPILGGTTKCFEWDAPKGHVLKTKSPFRVNGIIVPDKSFDDNSDDDDDEEYGIENTKPKKVK